MKALRIAVAGAGPAGLAAALMLHRRGHRVTIFERFDAPRPLSSGLMLQPTGLSVLAHLGLLDALLAAVLGEGIAIETGAEIVAIEAGTLLDPFAKAGIAGHDWRLAGQRKMPYRTEP